MQLSDLKPGEPFEARDPARHIQYAGRRGHPDYDNDWLSLTWIAGRRVLGPPEAMPAAAIQQACNEQGFTVTRTG